MTRPQKYFNTLIRQSEKARQTLVAWHDGIGTYRQAHVQVVLPLEYELLAARTGNGCSRWTNCWASRADGPN
ncbi:hypothetical protein CKY39_32435 [Variovorax boronicumulans]|uniref:Uncharacterized protein n=1 Tax=Variovorax boronicumulans TaxID=436515 RepID=A0A286NSA6_9BURK|nr:hypothetical protein [Variovorax boronicumulans]ATA57414.1 hypothetical protein CKY39_32435 [Variovorax boronicumulans]